jgi:hypothetical protein
MTIITQVLGLEDNKDGYLYKAVVITLGLYVLYLFEVALHYCNAHAHHHGLHQPVSIIIIICMHDYDNVDTHRARK